MIYVIKQLFFEIKMNVLFFGLIIILIMLGNVIGTIFFNIVENYYYLSNDNYAILSTISFEYPLLFKYAVIFPIILLTFFFEAYYLGWDDSSMNRLMNKSNNSRRTDAIYFILYSSYILHIIGFILSFGLGYYISLIIRDYFDLRILLGINPVLGFFVQILAGSFVFIGCIDFYIQNIFGNYIRFIMQQKT